MRPPASAISHSWLEVDQATSEATGLHRCGGIRQPGSLARMSTPPPEGLPDPEDVFDHLRREDGEHVGYIEMSADGRFIPYDRLWARRGEAMELDVAEAVLDAIGLRLLAEDWLLEEEDPQTGEASWTRVRIREIHRDHVIVARAMEDLSATSVAKSVDLIGAIELPLPTTRLRSAS